MPKKSDRSVQLVGVGSTTRSLARQCWRSVSRGPEVGLVAAPGHRRVVAVVGAMDDPVHHARPIPVDRRPGRPAPTAARGRRRCGAGCPGARPAAPSTRPRTRVELGPPARPRVDGGQPGGIGEPQHGGRLQHQLLARRPRRWAGDWLGQVGQVVDQAVELVDDAPGVGGVVDQQVDGPGHLHDRPGTASEDDQALGRLEQRLDQQVLDHPGPPADQDGPHQPHQGLGPLEAPSGVEEQPGRVPLHVLGRQAGQGEEGLQQALQAGLDADQLGRWAVAQPGQLLFDVTDQLPGVARELLPHRVGGVDQQPEGRDQAAVHAGVEEQGQGPAVGRDVGWAAGPAPVARGRRSAPGLADRWPRLQVEVARARTPGRSRRPSPRAASRTWRDSAPPSTPTPSGWSSRASTVRMRRMTSSACSAVRPRTNSWAATRPGSGVTVSGATGGRTVVRADRSQALCCRAGSVDATQVSLLVPSRRLEIISVVGPAPTRVSPPGRTLYPWLRPALLPSVGHGEGAQDRRPGLERAGAGRPSGRWTAR